MLGSWVYRVRPHIPVSDPISRVRPHIPRDMTPRQIAYRIQILKIKVRQI